jgi:superfamily I DNA/RNA helicase
MDHKAFVSHQRCMLIAPAGYGKTHSIVESLKYTEGRQLILTHTHSGVASIRSKIVKCQLPRGNYQIETIMGYAQKYVEAFNKRNIPSRTNTKLYYDFIISEATRLLSLKPISNILLNSYSGIYVDEYQDCTIEQHELILVLSKILPLRILGDPLQSIFSFDGNPMVDLTNVSQMAAFQINKFELTEPWRWKEKNNQLGLDLKEIRNLIDTCQPIDLTKFTSIKLITIKNENDIYDVRLPYYKALSVILKDNDLLLIHPETTSVYPRLRLIKGFSFPITLLESIDDKEFYTCALLLDTAKRDNISRIVYEISLKLFSKTVIHNWFNEKGDLKNKKNILDQKTSSNIKQGIDMAMNELSYSNIAKAIRCVFALKGIRCFRRELYFSIIRSLDYANSESVSVNDAMINHRNLIRQLGRNIKGRCIGTTLLTKGLEFDSVVILNAHKFKCPKNLYVALTRASKKLTVFSESSILSPEY